MVWLGCVVIQQFHPNDRLEKSQSTILYQASTTKNILQQNMSAQENRVKCVLSKTRHNKTQWHVLQIVKPISISIRQLYLSIYNLEFSTASRVFFHRATNPYAEIYVDQQNSNADLQLVAVSAMSVCSG
jgi:hypothetical protein